MKTSLFVLALLGLTQGLKHEGRVQSLLDNLAQSKVQGTHTCSSGIDRLKAPADWASIIGSGN
jgi:hypothetical protein